MMHDRIFNVLFLCTGNSARSIMAEALMQWRGRGKFNAYSAGSIPRGRVHPLALDILKRNNFNTEGFRSKSWSEFAGDAAPSMDFVFTVCDRASNEVCPVWPGQPVSAHWSIEDPDRPDLDEAEQGQLFEKAWRQLHHRITLFTVLPIDKLDKLSLQRRLDDIGMSFPDDL